MDFQKIISNMRNHKIISGTLILTAANFLTKIIGFFYRIYIAQVFSDESIGILQLASPVIMLFFSISAIGMQSAISRFIASAKNTCLYFFTGIASAFVISILCSVVLYQKADIIATNILLESRCEPLLRIHAISLPLSTLHACMNGYFFGRQKSVYPAISQIIEQAARILFIYFFITYAVKHNLQYSLSITILGSLLGELISVIFSVLVLLLEDSGYKKLQSTILSKSQKLYLKYYMEQTLFANKLLFSHAVPISCNRILISCFNGLEATLLPNRLICFGFTQKAALSTYGVMAGMAFPVVFFPASILNAICVLLFPTIAKAQSEKNYGQIKKSVFLSSAFALLIGIGSSFVFLLFGHFIGTLLFQSKEAGIMITNLGYLCPLLYLPGILITILNALGYTTKTLIFQIISVLVRLSFVFFVIPKVGILAYFYGIFLSQLLLTLLNFLALHKHIVYNDSGLSEIKIRKESHHGI